MSTVRQHLLSRHVNFDVHSPVVDEVNRVATFYLYNLSGQIVGFQEYRPDQEKLQNNDPRGRYFTYRGQPTVTAFGVESLDLSPHVVFIVEGIFDATRITGRGYSALAALSNSPSKDFGNFLSMLSRRVVAVCDNDVPGKELAKFGNCCVVTTEHDLGDSSEEFVTELLKKFG